jgi:NAD(P)-dependent dehydrogenase (short-subunit alcohol dehydrogenase family)
MAPYIAPRARSLLTSLAIQEELSPNAEFYRADASSPSDTEALMNFVAEHFGRIDCVVNNAGVGGGDGPIAETSIEGFNQSIALLLGGTFFGIKYSVPHMKAGTIINISSISGVTAGYSRTPIPQQSLGLLG